MLDKKNQKYDRQLRLWQSHGQASLEKAHVCCIQATATGAETLKNLVLPGIGSFTLIDDQCITEIDLSHCFFLHPSKLGQSRAKVIAEYLCELNEEVVGLFLQE
ncbi:NEDD8-activating enzyme E1 regulatory subunit, partial [Coelomomyces lativittatus]